MFETPEERLLVQRCLERQPGAWESFLEKYLALFHHTARKTAHLAGISAPVEDLEDCLAEILMEILAHQFRCLKSFQGESSLGTFLLVIAQRRAAKFWVQRKEDSSHTVNLADYSDIPENKDPIEKPMAIGEELGKLLSHLPPCEREAVRLHHIEGFSYSEVASQLRIPVNSVGPLLSKARKRLNRVAQK